MRSLTYNDAGGPGVDQENRADQEGAGQYHTDWQQKPVSQADVLFPEQERVSVRVVQQTLAAKFVADGPHTFNCLHKVTGLAEAI